MNKLELVIMESGVEESTALTLKNSFTPFLIKANEWADKAKELVVTDISQTREMKMAREARLALKDVRVAADKKRKELKEDSIRYGKAVQFAYNTIEGLITPIEEHLQQQEDFAKIAEAKRKAELKAQREEELKQYGDYVPLGIDFGDLTDNAYQTMVAGIKAQIQAKIDAERKAEEERIEAERKIILHDVRMGMLIPYWNFVPAANRYDNLSDLTESEWKERFDWCVSEKKKDDEEKEKQRIENERLKTEAEAQKRMISKRNEELRPYIVFIRDYNKMLYLPEEQYQKELADVKTGAELQWEFDRMEANKAIIEREAAELILETERKIARDAAEKAALEKAALEAEIKAKRDAEIKAEQEAKAAEKARLLAEKKAKSAPDKEKLIAFAAKIAAIEYPELLSEEGKDILVIVHENLITTQNYILTQVETL